MVWPYLKILWCSKDESTGQSKRKKKTRRLTQKRWKIILKCWQSWTRTAQLGQLRTEKNGRGLLIVICGAPVTMEGYGIGYTRPD